MGPLASAQQLVDALEGIGELQRDGRLIVGSGKRADGVGSPAGRGYFVQPTLLEAADANGATTVHQREVFAPVATLLPMTGAPPQRQERCLWPEERSSPPSTAMMKVGLASSSMQEPVALGESTSVPRRRSVRVLALVPRCPRPCMADQVGQGEVRSWAVWLEFNSTCSAWRFKVGRDLLGRLTDGSPQED